jgi:hypothetical protein
MHELNGLEDNISWRWTTDGQYSASSAYKIQFASNFSIMNLCPIWKAKWNRSADFLLGLFSIREF